MHTILPIGSQCKCFWLPVECLDGDVRLVGANSSSEGRVEVCYSGEYHSICDDFWDTLNAQVVCHQLGFSSALGNITKYCFSILHF